MSRKDEIRFVNDLGSLTNRSDAGQLSRSCICRTVPRTLSGCSVFFFIYLHLFATFGDTVQSALMPRRAFNNAAQENQGADHLWSSPKGNSLHNLWRKRGSHILRCMTVTKKGWSENAPSADSCSEKQWFLVTMIKVFGLK